VAGCCEYGDEPSGSDATDLVIYKDVNWLELSQNIPTLVF
jgi:hypothetical protein